MKKWVVLAALLAVMSLLAQKPGYWTVFAQDGKRYESEIFYGVIREEYVSDARGRRLAGVRFTDLEDGDILVTDSTYFFCYRHGHAAIVVDAEQGITLEAYGIGTDSEFSRVSEWERYPHVLVLRLNAPKEVRAAVAEYAKEALVGIPYRLMTGVVDDKDMNGEYWGTQCAHLVWAAYERFGYDIDGDGGWLVTPADFTNSPLLTVILQGQ